MKLKFNPEDLPVQSLATEAAVPASRLSADWLRQHFLQPPTWTPELADEHLLSTITSFKPASVLIPLVMRDQGLTLLLTHRAAHLNDHAGQISFPGGRCEDSDGSVVETALREAEEEVGLHRKHVDVIGILPEYLTGTGYQVTPVVALIQPPFELKIDSSEVASLFEVPLSFLMDGQNYQRRAFDLPNGQGQRVFYAIPYQQHFIWGATAGMLRNLFHLLRA
ncbi:CoA pyrophosphatase [Undibacterium sp. RTI2.1]|uniref:CoA pyrophosphatase n=1 Tax=unclassified Undibacterium TaxID=2630295 RepID=UPI002AB55C15|nr:MULTISPECIES: CoA pyrophosphatase [unclassified Undibacterium]MDY7538580.1 CoA pyrophosphatase [Undibacterium sp. 5I1]MEB0031269.1 CoA pyrophosphatase [Undibacterium sp. RTI2.1]MEB0232182.1 CoA pyrophosphatase [Undibacterium sp. 10I3]MEB0258082.1 CoA pyrophosphatase [Undibacterium sp. 5I1]